MKNIVNYTKQKLIMFVTALIILLVLEAALIAHSMYTAPVMEDEEINSLPEDR